MSIELKGLHGLNLLLENEKQNGNAQSFLNVPISSLVPCKYQPRKKFTSEEMTELTESIKVNGIIQPIVVRKLSKSNYEIIAGERRWRAAQNANLKTVPVVCRDVNDATVIAFSLIENIQRQDLNVVEEARAIQTMIDKFSFTQDEVAKILGKGRSSISNLLRILRLNSQVIELLMNESLEFGHAKVLLTFTEDEQMQIAQKIISNKLSVRETEKFVSESKKSTQKVQLKVNDTNIKIPEWQERLSKCLYLPVKINEGKNGKSRVVIDFNSSEEIEWFIKCLENRKL